MPKNCKRKKCANYETSFFLSDCVKKNSFETETEIVYWEEKTMDEILVCYHSTFTEPVKNRGVRPFQGR